MACMYLALSIQPGKKLESIDLGRNLLHHSTVCFNVDEKAVGTAVGKDCINIQVISKIEGPRNMLTANLTYGD